ncbi:MAG TPA: hypothetical protein VMW38_01025, partial [Terriglobia bacterium]|nr:hypothetical protein [Terriglobia bacterium]
FYIIATGAKNKKGQFIDVKPPLDHFISLTFQGGTLDAFVKAIAQAVTQKCDFKLITGMVPINLFLQTSVRVPSMRGTPRDFNTTDTIQVTSTSGTARDLLQNALDATGRKLAWQLLCEPGLCALNVHPVALKSVDPLTGAETYRPVD